MDRGASILGDAEFQLAEIEIHSSNPVGRQQLQRARDTLRRKLGETP